jgi:ribonuclease III
MTAISLAVPPDLEPRLDALQRRLRVSFHDRGLLFQALVHRSAINERVDLQLSSNERLEFLGDAVLGVVVAERLYAAFPAASEGVLTLTRAALVRASSLASWARTIELGQFLLLGRGEEVSGVRDHETLLASAFEAVVGAIYLDQGFEPAATFLDRFVAPHLQDSPDDRPLLDPKSRLQLRSQSERDAVPRYHVVDVTGPEHSPTFTIEVTVGGQPIARGSGRSKQAAGQAAALAALAIWDDQPGPADEAPDAAPTEGAAGAVDDGPGRAAGDAAASSTDDGATAAAGAAANGSAAAGDTPADAAGDGLAGAASDAPTGSADDGAANPTARPARAARKAPRRSSRMKPAEPARTAGGRRPAPAEET